MLRTLPTLGKHARYASKYTKAAASLPFKLDIRNMVKLKCDRQVNHFIGTDLSLNHIKSISNTVIANNPSKELTDIFAKRSWDISHFESKHLPVVVSDISNKKGFSKRKGRKFIWAMDFPIKMPGKGWAIPKELEQFTEFIAKSERFERLINPDIDKCYAYLCVDQRPVVPGTSQRRPGWHSDSFVTVETHGAQSDILTDSIYLAYDSLPTEFCEGPFTFTDASYKVASRALNHFDVTAEGQDVVTYEPYKIIKMDPTCIHRVGINDTDRTVSRTFIKLTFSTEVFNREGNDINYLFDYNWPMVPRSLERNTSSIVEGKVNGISISKYRPVTQGELVEEFDNEFEYCDYIYGEVMLAQKIGSVEAHPATPGELLQTEVNGFMTTHSYAKHGSWKVTTNLGDQYFVPLETLQVLYTFNTKTGMFDPVDNMCRVAYVGQPIVIKAPWGQPQYLTGGDYIVERMYDGHSDIYGVKADSFEANYEVA